MLRPLPVQESHRYLNIVTVDATKDEKKFMLREIALMKNIMPHQHIVKMLACCTKGGESTDITILSARSHGMSATEMGSTMVGVADTCHTKWVQDPLTATGSVNIHCRS